MLNFLFSHQVEETEEEIAEMYDDFPSEYSGGGSHTYESISPIPPREQKELLAVPTNQGQSGTVRHSGIDALQMYLNQENGEDYYADADCKEAESDLNVPRPIRAGAVSRLGHSSAIDQLKKVLASN